MLPGRRFVYLFWLILFCLSLLLLLVVCLLLCLSVFFWVVFALLVCLFAFARVCFDVGSLRVECCLGCLVVGVCDLVVCFWFFGFRLVFVDLILVVNVCILVLICAVVFGILGFGVALIMMGFCGLWLLLVFWFVFVLSFGFNFGFCFVLWIGL